MTRRIIAAILCAVLMCGCLPAVSAMSKSLPKTDKAAYTVGETVTVSWNAAANTSAYRVALKSGEDEVDSRLTNGSSCAFEYLNCGFYTTELYGVNEGLETFLGSYDFAVGNLSLKNGMNTYTVSGSEAVFESSAYPGSFLGAKDGVLSLTDAAAVFSISGYLLRRSYYIKLGTSPLISGEGVLALGSEGDTAERFFIIRQPDGKYVIESETDRGSVISCRDGQPVLEPFDGTPEQLWTVTSADYESIDLTAAQSLVTEQLPDKLTYLEKSELDTTGLICSVRYNTGIREYVFSGVEAQCDMNTPGTGTVSLSYKGLTSSYSIIINAITATQCTILTYPEKRVYALNEMLDMTGFSFHAVLSDGTEEDVSSGYEVLGFRSDTPGTKLAVVTYRGSSMIIVFTVGSKQLTDFYILREPFKTEYLAGEELELTGLYACIEYSDGTVEFTDEYSVSGYESREGSYTVTLAYGGLSDSFAVTVKKAEVSSLEIVNMPAKLTYQRGELFAPDGLTLLAVFEDGDTAIISKGITLYGYNPYLAGEQTVTAEYGGAVVSFAINVIDPEGEYILGDVDGDTFVTTSDARLALRAAAGLTSLTNLQKLAADLDGDGLITTTDARIILRKAANLE